MCFSSNCWVPLPDELWISKLSSIRIVKIFISNIYQDPEPEEDDEKDKDKKKDKKDKKDKDKDKDKDKKEGDGDGEKKVEKKK